MFLIHSRDSWCLAQPERKIQVVHVIGIANMSSACFKPQIMTGCYDRNLSYTPYMENSLPSERREWHRINKPSWNLPRLLRRTIRNYFPSSPRRKKPKSIARRRSYYISRVTIVATTVQPAFIIARSVWFSSVSSQRPAARSLNPCFRLV